MNDGASYGPGSSSLRSPEPVPVSAHPGNDPSREGCPDCSLCGKPSPNGDPCETCADANRVKGSCLHCGAPLVAPKVEPGTAIGKRRAELGLSLQRVGNLAGITKAQVWEIERKGGTKNPRLKTLVGLARALQWPIETLIQKLAP